MTPERDRALATLDCRSNARAIRGRVRDLVDGLRELAATKHGPPPDELHLLVTDLDDYPAIDADPDGNFLSGVLAGMAEALDVSPAELIRWAEETF